MSTRALGFFAALLLIGGLSAACGSDDSDDLVFTESDSSISVDEGQRFTIQLEGNPTTGFNWEISTAPDSSVVESVVSEYVAADADEDVVGSGGVFDFEFEAVGAGSTTIEFEYAQASAGVEDTASFSVEVSDG